MKEEVNCWNLNLGVTEINEKLAKKIKGRIIKRFNKIYRSSEYYSKLLDMSPQHSQNILYWICKGKTKKYTYPTKNQEIAIPIKHLIKIAKDLNITKGEVEKSLVCIRNSHSPMKLYYPKFPIRMNPLLSSLVFHYYCDGSHENWAQSIEKHPKNRKRYFQKIERSIGKIHGWNSKKHKGIYTPVIIYQIIEKLFDIKRINFTKIKFPKEILKLDRENLIGALISIIIDEGHICKDHYEIRISQKDKEAIQIFYKICKKLKYDVAPPTKGKNRDIYTIKIKSTGLFRLHKDLTILNKKYNQILDLGDKQKLFEEKIKTMRNVLKKENSKQPKGYSTNINDEDMKVLEYFKKPMGKRKISKLTGKSLSSLHHTKGKLKNKGFIRMVGWKKREPLLKITKKGKDILSNWWKNKEEQEIKFKENIFKEYINFNEKYKREPRIREFCNKTKELNLFRYYKTWERKKIFLKELIDFQSFIKIPVSKNNN